MDPDFCNVYHLESIDGDRHSHAIRPLQSV